MKNGHRLTRIEAEAKQTACLDFCEEYLPSKNKWKIESSLLIHEYRITHSRVPFFSKIVLVAIQDEGSSKMYRNVYSALIGIGARRPLRKKFRSSFALIGFTGQGRPRFVKQVSGSLA